MADTSIIVDSGFFDSINKDRLYSAAQMNMPYKDLISEGVYGAISGSLSQAFAVAAGVGMQIFVNVGKALLGGRWVSMDEGASFDVPSNSSGSARIDSVILRVDTNNSARNASLIYRTGGSSAPSLVTTTGITETRIANITIASGASSITAASIADKRTFAKLNVANDQLEDVLLQIIEDHPELVTTVPDGAITKRKLATEVAEQIDGNTQGISDLNDALNANGLSVVDGCLCVTYTE